MCHGANMFVQGAVTDRPGTSSKKQLKRRKGDTWVSHHLCAKMTIAQVWLQGIAGYRYCRLQGTVRHSSLQVKLTFVVAVYGIAHRFPWSPLSSEQKPDLFIYCCDTRVPVFTHTRGGRARAVHVGWLPGYTAYPRPEGQSTTCLEA